MNQCLIILAFLISIFSFSPTYTKRDNTTQIESVREQFHSDLDQYMRAIESFAICLNDQSCHHTHGYYSTLRAKYKRLEFLIAYLDPEAESELINGAPLLKQERKAPSSSVVKPKGLQVIDEYMGADPLDRKTLLFLSNQLHQDSEQIIKYLKSIKLYDYQVYSALRLEILRNYTLGLTGFDTPGTSQAVSDGIEVFSSMHDYVRIYSNDPSSVNNSLIESIEKNIKQVINTLRKSDFENLDRLGILRNKIMPLYSLILDWHKQSGIELPHEVDPRLNAVNYQSKSLFDEDFLNVNFYTAGLDTTHLKKKIDLGKLLFHDPILSKKVDLSCSSCHNAELAFTDGLKTALAEDESKMGHRNSMTLVNAVYSTDYFYDLRGGNLQAQLDHVIFNEHEFNIDYAEILKRLESSSEYSELFLSAFASSDNKIHVNQIKQALVAYIADLKSFNSPFDKYARGETVELDHSAKAGYNLFMGKAACGTCHFPPTFAGLLPPQYQDTESEVLGVPSIYPTNKASLDTDLGRFSNGIASDHLDFYENSFKTTTVRNASITAPYMHNGAINSLEDLMAFYNAGGGAGMGMNLEHQTLSPDSLGLSDVEIKEVIAFIESLTDTTLNVSPQLKLPFIPGEAYQDRKVQGNY